MQKTFLTKVNVAFLVILATINWINAADECNKCMSNTVMCVDETHFQICNDGVQLATKHACANGTSCTNSPKICSTATEITGSVVSVCKAGVGECTKCSELPDRVNYACVSKTQRNICMGGVPLEDPLPCQTDEICCLEEYKKGGKICLPQCVAEYANYEPTCSNDVPPTKAPNPTPAPADMKARCLADCRAQGKPTFCYTSSPDTTDCKRYIYCEQTGATYDYVMMTCESGYWDNIKQECGGKTCPVA